MGCPPSCRGWSRQVTIYCLLFERILVLTTFRRRLLILGYFSGLQIWDCTNLDSITELLNVSGPGWGRILHAEVLPNPLTSTHDQFLSLRPLLGIMCGLGLPFAYFILTSLCSAKSPHQTPDFLVYSLSSHKVVKKLSIPGITSLSASPTVIIIVSGIRSCLVKSQLYLRARQTQLPSVSFHLALSHPYLSSLRASPPLHILDHRRQLSRTPMLMYYRQLI